VFGLKTVRLNIYLFRTKSEKLKCKSTVFFYVYLNITLIGRYAIWSNVILTLAIKSVLFIFSVSNQSKASFLLLLPVKLGKDFFKSSTTGTTGIALRL